MALQRHLKVFYSLFKLVAASGVTEADDFSFIQCKTVCAHRVARPWADFVDTIVYS